MATGFHGFHVIVGTIFLSVCLIRAYKGDFTPKQHFGFEAAAWYWHFVDVVWLFLFTSIYVWGGWGAPVHGVTSVTSRRLSRRQLRGDCPRCGAHTLFDGWIAFAHKCRACGLDFDAFNVGDGPAAFLILIVGAIVVGAAITLELAAEPPMVGASGLDPGRGLADDRRSAGWARRPCSPRNIGTGAKEGRIVE